MKKLKSRKKIEKINKKEYPKVEDVLSKLAAGTFLGLSILVPIIPIAMQPFLGPWEAYHSGELKRMLKEFREKGLVKIGEEDGGSVVKITQLGREKAVMKKLLRKGVAKKGKWDERFWVVAFDIPDNYKRAREYFRGCLRRLNFFELQESVFIYPYDCRSEIDFLRTTLGIGSFVKIMVVEEIEGEESLKRKFKLK